MSIGELGGSAFQVRELNNVEVCEYCDKRVLHDARDLMYWVPLSTILLYECRMALMEEQKKKKARRLDALETVQTKLAVGTKVCLVFGPMGLKAGKPARGVIYAERTVSARTRTGVEFKNERGLVSELAWPLLRNINLTERGFEIVDDKDTLLVRYEWAADAQFAAQ